MVITDFSETAYHEIPATLKEALQRTLFAVDKENDRYALGGVCFKRNIGAGTLCVVVTNGRRLAVKHVSGTCVNDHKFEPAILPVNYLQDGSRPAIFRHVQDLSQMHSGACSLDISAQNVRIRHRIARSRCQIAPVDSVHIHAKSGKTMKMQKNKKIKGGITCIFHFRVYNRGK